MSELAFAGESTTLTNIKELEGEQNYFNEVKRLDGKEKIVKLGKIFNSKEEAIDYINRTPSRRNDSLNKFIPKTDWVLQDKDGRVEAVVMMDEIKGTRMDKVDLRSLTVETVTDFDDFMYESLVVYEQEGICPGINLKNFVIDGRGKTFYVDSEPYPPYTILPFEMAHARENRLKKIFGEDFRVKFPKTNLWIEKHRAENYKMAKRDKMR